MRQRGTAFRRVMLAVALTACAAPAAAAGTSIEGTVTIFEKQGKPKARDDGVVVFLDELEHPESPKPPEAHAVLRQSHKQFTPEVLPVVVGTTVEFPNEDTVFHNVFSLSRVKPFDLGLYAQGESRSVTFDQPGLVKVYCNIHPQMVASILVLANPHFAVTDAQGRFVISGVPLGKAKVRSWYARSRSSQEREVVVTPEGIKDLNLTILENLRFEIQEETVSVEHKNKLGQDYPKRY